jgi:large subunit ribosomal protein L15
LLDLDKLKIGKVLGTGSINSALSIKVGKISESAKSKILAAGGEVLLSNELNTE